MYIYYVKLRVFVVRLRIVCLACSTAPEPQPAAPLSLEDENAKLKRELEELKRMMQRN